MLSLQIDTFIFRLSPFALLSYHLQMRQYFRPLIFFLLAWFACSGLASAQQEKIYQPLFGTGFIVSNDGHIVTAYHNIQNKKQVLILLSEPNHYETAEVVRVDAKKDLALLKTKLTGKALRISPWNEVPIGLEVYAIGYPQPDFQGMSRKITQGIINGDYKERGNSGFFQFSAAPQQGNSGGPLLAPDGSVIGVVIQKLNALSVAEKTKDLSQNVNYAIKSSTLLAFLKESGLPVSVNTLNLQTHLRAYEVYRQTAGSIVIVAAGNKTASPSGIQSTTKP